ncbi:ATP-binding protein [haloarchaeon 3A1-DGR]|nr:ATP-binding protein [haloarchaeon 3A1-DGR]
MSTHDETRPASVAGDDSDDISLLEVVQSPDLLLERLETDTPEGLDRVRQITGDARSHTVGANMRRAFGFRRFSRVLEDLVDTDHPGLEGGSHPIVQHPRAFLDHLIHVDDMDKLRIEHDELEGLSRSRREIFEWLQDRPEIVSDLRNGGTDWLAHGPKGSGKSTMATALVIRQLEINPDAVVWRGSPARAEWLPFRAWVRLCLPAGIDVEAELDPPSDDVDPIPVDLEDVVHEVVRYQNIRDLNHNVLEEGWPHVVFPDPKFRGATEAYREADEIQEIDHVSAWRAAADDELGPGDVTPSEMWWFAWAIDKIDHGPPFWTSFFCDEIGNLMPEHASNDYHRLHDRISAFRDKYVDARRNKFSEFGIGHDPDDLHSFMRKKKRWRITLSGTDNPTGPTTGMGEAPMERNYTNRMRLGQALSWNSQNYAEFSWSDIPSEMKVPGQLHIRFPGVMEVLA